MTTLVVAALHEEVVHVARDFEVLVTGVGKVNAATALARRLAEPPRPARVVNIGTAGAVDGSVTGIVEIEVVTQHDFPYLAIEGLLGRRLSQGYLLSAEAPPRAVMELPRGARALASGDSFVADAGTAGRIAGRGVQLVDMEGFAIAATCAAFDMPFVCVKAISDVADAEAAETWLDAVDGCARALAEWVDRHVRPV